VIRLERVSKTVVSGCPWIVLGGFTATTVLVVTVGALSTWDVIVKKPLLIMREE
jgi:hypothetical protein